MDFYESLPNGQELMVVVDEFARMPVIGEVKTTAAEHVLQKLDDLFSFLGKPDELKTDNGPPFNGAKFREFADFYGFRHRKITPEHPQANGQVEKLMFEIVAVIQNAIIEHKDWRQELNRFLRSYRSTLHLSTGVAPSILLFGGNRTNRLPSLIEERKTFDEFTAMVIGNDQRTKAKSKQYTDRKRKAKKHNFKIGETVILRQKRLNKFMPAFNTLRHFITNIKGSMISVRAEDG
jgi:hypothetical protein